jgi:hypothetical protein
MMRKVHLLPPRGGAACGRQFVETTPEINEVNCEECIAEHEAYLEEQERRYG